MCVDISRVIWAEGTSKIFYVKIRYFPKKKKTQSEKKTYNLQYFRVRRCIYNETNIFYQHYSRDSGSHFFKDIAKKSSLKKFSFAITYPSRPVFPFAIDWNIACVMYFQKGHDDVLKNLYGLIYGANPFYHFIYQCMK